MPLLELPESVQAQVEGGILPPATAYEISKVSDQAEQAELADRVVREKLSRQDTARVVRERKQAGAGEQRGRPTPAPRGVAFATQHGQVTVVAAEDAVIAALEEALAQACRAAQPAPGVNAEAA